MDAFIAKFTRLKKRLLSSGKSMTRNPSSAWNVLLALLGVGLLGAAIAGYLTYLNVSAVKDPELPAGGSRGVLEPADVTAVLKVYQDKKERLNALIADKPEFRSPGKGSAPAPATSTPPTLPEVLP